MRAGSEVRLFGGSEGWLGGSEGTGEGRLGGSEGRVGGGQGVVAATSLRCCGEKPGVRREAWRGGWSSGFPARLRARPGDDRWEQRQEPRRWERHERWVEQQKGKKEGKGGKGKNKNDRRKGKGDKGQGSKP